jgi:hypothetical protein
MAGNGERLDFELFADALDGNGDIFFFHVGEGVAQRSIARRLGRPVRWSVRAISSS